MDYRFDLEVVVGAPPDDLFAVLTDLAQAPRWMHALVGLEVLTKGPLELGFRWREIRKMLGREVVEIFEVIQLEPPRKLALRVDGRHGSSRRGEFLFDHEVSRHPMGSRLRTRCRIHRPGRLTRVFGWIFVRALRQVMRRDMEALRGYVESSTAARRTAQAS